MFSSLKQKLLLGLYIFLLLSIPTGTYLASQHQNPNVSAKEDRNITKVEPLPTISPAIKDIQDLSVSSINPSPSPNSSPLEGSNFGPIMDFILNLEGRPDGKQLAKVFVGIAEGEITTNPKYLLTFSVTTGSDGRYPNISLAGLTTGNRYTAYLKGPSQIVTASTFTMSGFLSHLNDSQPLIALSGDLNDDNIIDNVDLTIAKSNLGQNSTSSNFNDNADINRDGIVNSFDLNFIIKNMNQIGVSGIWTSQPPKP